MYSKALWSVEDCSCEQNASSYLTVESYISRHARVFAIYNVLYIYSTYKYIDIYMYIYK